MLRGTGLIIQETAPDTSKTGIYYTYIWLKPSTQQFFSMDGTGGWIEAAVFPEGVTPEVLANAIAGLSVIYAAIDHTHTNLGELTVEGDVQFNRLIKVGDLEGVTAEISVKKIESLTFKNGILVKYD
jgi:hypothetical protein